jgi:hypothetical protein
MLESGQEIGGVASARLCQSPVCRIRVIYFHLSDGHGQPTIFVTEMSERIDQTRHRGSARSRRAQAGIMLRQIVGVAMD